MSGGGAILPFGIPSQHGVALLQRLAALLEPDSALVVGLSSLMDFQIQKAGGDCVQWKLAAALVGVSTTASPGWHPVASAQLIARQKEWIHLIKRELEPHLYEVFVQQIIKHGGRPKFVDSSDSSNSSNNEEENDFDKKINFANLTEDEQEEIISKKIMEAAAFLINNNNNKSTSSSSSPSPLVFAPEPFEFLVLSHPDLKEIMAEKKKKEEEEEEIKEEEKVATMTLEEYYKQLIPVIPTAALPFPLFENAAGQKILSEMCRLWELIVNSIGEQSEGEGEEGKKKTSRFIPVETMAVEFITNLIEFCRRLLACCSARNSLGEVEAKEKVKAATNTLRALVQLAENKKLSGHELAAQQAKAAELSNAAFYRKLRSSLDPSAGGGGSAAATAAETAEGEERQGAILIAGEAATGGGGGNNNNNGSSTANKGIPSISNGSHQSQGLESRVAELKKSIGLIQQQSAVALISLSRCLTMSEPVLQSNYHLVFGTTSATTASQWPFVDSEQKQQQNDDVAPPPPSPPPPQHSKQPPPTSTFSPFSAAGSVPDPRKWFSPRYPVLSLLGEILQYASLHRGIVLSLVGPSGCGKTELARSIMHHWRFHPGMKAHLFQHYWNYPMTGVVAPVRAWLNGTSMETDLANMCRRQFSTALEEDDKTASGIALKGALARDPKQWLIVADNLSEFGAAQLLHVLPGFTIADGEKSELRASLRASVVAANSIRSHTNDNRGHYGASEGQHVELSAAAASAYLVNSPPIFSGLVVTTSEKSLRSLSYHESFIEFEVPELQPEEAELLMKSILFPCAMESPNISQVAAARKNSSLTSFASDPNLNYASRDSLRRWDKLNEYRLDIMENMVKHDLLPIDAKNALKEETQQRQQRQEKQREKQQYQQQQRTTTTTTESEKKKDGEDTSSSSSSSFLLLDSILKEELPTPFNDLLAYSDFSDKKKKTEELVTFLRNASKSPQCLLLLAKFILRYVDKREKEQQQGKVAAAEPKKEDGGAEEKKEHPSSNGATNQEEDDGKDISRNSSNCKVESDSDLSDGEEEGGGGGGGGEDDNDDDDDGLDIEDEDFDEEDLKALGFDISKLLKRKKAKEDKSRPKQVARSASFLESERKHEALVIEGAQRLLRLLSQVLDDFSSTGSDRRGSIIDVSELDNSVQNSLLYSKESALFEFYAFASLAARFGSTSSAFGGINLDAILLSSSLEQEDQLQNFRSACASFCNDWAAAGKIGPKNNGSSTTKGTPPLPPKKETAAASATAKSKTANNNISAQPQQPEQQEEGKRDEKEEQRGPVYYAPFLQSIFLSPSSPLNTNEKQQQVAKSSFETLRVVVAAILHSLESTEEEEQEDVEEKECGSSSKRRVLSTPQQQSLEDIALKIAVADPNVTPAEFLRFCFSFNKQQQQQSETTTSTKEETRSLWDRSVATLIESGLVSYGSRYSGALAAFSKTMMAEADAASSGYGFYEMCLQTSCSVQKAILSVRPTNVVSESVCSIVMAVAKLMETSQEVFFGESPLGRMLLPIGTALWSRNSFANLDASCESETVAYSMLLSSLSRWYEDTEWMHLSAMFQQISVALVRRVCTDIPLSLQLYPIVAELCVKQCEVANLSRSYHLTSSTAPAVGPDRRAIDLIVACISLLSGGWGSPDVNLFDSHFSSLSRDGLNRTVVNLVKKEGGVSNGDEKQSAKQQQQQQNGTAKHSSESGSDQANKSSPPFSIPNSTLKSQFPHYPHLLSRMINEKQLCYGKTSDMTLIQFSLHKDIRLDIAHSTGNIAYLGRNLKHNRTSSMSEDTNGSNSSSSNGNSSSSSSSSSKSSSLSPRTAVNIYEAAMEILRAAAAVMNDYQGVDSADVSSGWNKFYNSHNSFSTTSPFSPSHYYDENNDSESEISNSSKNKNQNDNKGSKQPPPPFFPHSVEWSSRLANVVLATAARLKVTAADIWLSVAFDSACLVSRIIVEHHEAAGKPEQDALAYLCIALGKCALRAGLSLESARLLQSALRTLNPDDREENCSDPAVISGLCGVAHVALINGKVEMAIPCLRRTLMLAHRLLGPAHPETAQVYMYAAMAMARKDQEIAVKNVLRSLSIFEDLLGPRHATILTTLCRVGSEFYHRGAYDNALEVFTEVLMSLNATRGGGCREHIEAIPVLNDMGRCYHALQKWDDSERCLVETIRAIRRLDGGLGVHPFASIALCNLAVVLTAKAINKEQATTTPSAIQSSKTERAKAWTSAISCVRSAICIDELLPHSPHNHPSRLVIPLSALGTILLARVGEEKLDPREAMFVRPPPPESRRACDSAVALATSIFGSEFGVVPAICQVQLAASIAATTSSSSGDDGASSTTQVNKILRRAMEMVRSTGEDHSALISDLIYFIRAGLPPKIEPTDNSTPCSSSAGALIFTPMLLQPMRFYPDYGINLQSMSSSLRRTMFRATPFYLHES